MPDYDVIPNNLCMNPNSFWTDLFCKTSCSFCTRTVAWHS